MTATVGRQKTKTQTYYLSHTTLNHHFANQQILVTCVFIRVKKGGEVDKYMELWPMSYSCWPWRFPGPCSAVGSVWKRWHGSLWTAIFRGDLPYRLESGREDRKGETKGGRGWWIGMRNMEYGNLKKKPEKGSGDEMNGKEGKRSREEARFSSFFTPMACCPEQHD